MDDLGYILDLLKRERYFGLAGNDGCPCANLEIRSVVIDTHCHRSGCTVCEFGGIHVYSDSLEFDNTAEVFGPIAAEVKEQITEIYKLGAEFNVCFVGRDGNER